MKKYKYITKRTFLMKCVYLLLILLLIPSVSAIGISLNPADISIADLRKGGYAERYYTIGTSSTENLNVSILRDNNYEITDWLTFEPNVDSFIISNSKSMRLKMIIQPPVDIPNGNYQGIIRFKVESDRSFGGQTGSVIEVGVGSKLSFNVSDNEILKCQVTNGRITNAEQDNPIKFSFRMTNLGNTIVRPDLYIEIWDKEQKNIVKTYSERIEEIKPTVSNDRIINMDTFDLDIGQYFANIKIDRCNYLDTKTFDILRIGELSVSGTLIQIKNKVWNNVGDNIDIFAVFENSGEAVTALFKGAIMLDDEIIEVLESGNVEVGKGETIEIPLVFEPKKSGRYIVKGRIHYNNKQTFEKSNVINVNPKDVNYDGTTLDVLPSQTESTYIYYIIIGIMILIMLILIRKRNRK